MTRIFVVDDSPFIRKAILRIFSDQPEMQVVGTAQSGEEALERLPATRPHVVTLDVEMPGMAPVPDVLFAILLTGMGEDGAEGMLAVRRSGGLTFAESEASCVVYGMPRAAHKRGGVSRMLSLSQICELFAARSDDP
jgi:two-component system chemotaxis response regulator CheB